MSDVRTAPALRARSTPQLLDAMFAVTRAHAWDLFALGLLFHAPVHIFRIAAQFGGKDSFAWRADPELYLGSFWWSTWNWLAVTATAIAACQFCLDGDTSIRRALGALRAGGWRLLGTVAGVAIILDGLFTITSGTLGKIPGLGLAAFILLTAAVPWCAPAIPVSATERLAPWTAIGRSLWLVRRNFWRVAIVIWIIWAATSLADSELVSLVYRFSHRGPVSRVADVVVDSALYPLRGIAIALVYLDCRVRREAFDIERMLPAA